MLALSSLSRFSFMNLTSGLAIRRYTRGAEKLFHRVDWDRAVGLVIVVDPFDPGSLLYLPQAGYTDLIKTALANRSPLVVVHGLSDEVPIITIEVDTTVKPNVEYRVFTVSGKVVHRVPLSQNSPPPFRTPWTTVGGKPPLLSNKGSGNRGVGIETAPPGVESDEPKGPSKPSPVEGGHTSPSGDHNGFTEAYPGFGKLCLDYAERLREIRSDFNIDAWKTLRSTSLYLARHLWQPRPRVWSQFVPSSLGLVTSETLVWPGTEASPWRRPFRKNGRIEALLLHLYAWSGATLLARSSRSLQWVFTILGKFILLWQNNGLKSACAAFKEAQRVLMKFLAGTPVAVSEISGVPVGIDRGLPTFLPRGLRRYIRDGHVGAIRIAFFALNVADVLKYTAPATLETITRPYDGTLVRGFVDKEIQQGVEDLIALSARPRAPVWKGFHATLKAGPMGKAMASAPLDAVALTESNCWNPFLEFARYVKNSDTLIRKTEWLSFLVSSFMRPYWGSLLGTLPLGKLSKVVEPRGKVRTVAIPGYQVQSLLKPLHDSLFSFLKGLETDHTFNQDGGVLRCMNSGHSVMNSYDLSAATDRFPRWFESAVLSHLYNGVVSDSEAMAQAWETLLENLVFQYRKTRKGIAELITYGSGQPMGCYSSWASFAVAHHVCVQIAARRAGFERYIDYDLLGDDIVLRGDSDQHALLFSHYLELMKSLGVGINPKKGVSSANGTFEFAKRFVRGQDILSSLRWKELAAATGWHGVYNLINGMNRRGLVLPHIRVALEVGYCLIHQRPYAVDLTDIRRVALVSRGVFATILILLTSPLGPYKVPFVAWLSGRGVNLVDFHPNLGHFVNGVKDVSMGNDVHFPIAEAMDRVRKTLERKVLEAQGVAFSILRTLSKSMKINFVKGSSDFGHQASAWKYPDNKSISESMKSFDFRNFDSIVGLMGAMGVNFRYSSKNEGPKVLQFPVGIPEISTNYRGSGSWDYVLGLFRSIVWSSPSHAVNRKALLELLGPKVLSQTPAADPDWDYLFGATQRGSFATVADKLSQLVQAIVPPKYQHPSVLFASLRQSLTEFMKVSVDDILPSALPQHMDLFETMNQVQTSAIISSWRKLRDDAFYRTDLIFSFHEKTEESAAPAYLLEYTNSIRLCAKNGDLIPRPQVAQLTSLRPANMFFDSELYKPRVGYEHAFIPKYGISRERLADLLLIKNQELGLNRVPRAAFQTLALRLESSGNSIGYFPTRPY